MGIGHLGLLALASAHALALVGGQEREERHHGNLQPLEGSRDHVLGRLVHVFGGVALVVLSLCCALGLDSQLVVARLHRELRCVPA